MQINDILILADNIFTSNKKEVIKAAKIMRKDSKYLTFAQFIKCNWIQIKLDLDGIVSI